MHARPMHLVAAHTFLPNFSPCLEPGNLLQNGPMLGKDGEAVYGTPDRSVVAIVATCCLVRAWLFTGRQWKTRYHCVGSDWGEITLPCVWERFVGMTSV